jgi:hypothetical protein
MPSLNGVSTPLSEREIHHIFPHFQNAYSDSGRASPTPSLEEMEGFNEEKYATILPRSKRFPPAAH